MDKINYIGDNLDITVAIKRRDLNSAFTELIDRTIEKYRAEIEQNPRDILYTIKQVCQILSVDKSTLWRWSQSGYLVPTKVGDLPRYRKSQIDELMGKRGGGVK